MAILSGCGPAPNDDGGTAVRKGLWKNSAAIESVQFGDEYMEGDNLPAELLDLAETEERCLGERFMNRRQLEEDLERRLNSSCTIDEFETSSTSMRGSGKCDRMADASLDFYPDLSFDGTLDGERTDTSVVLEGGATDPDTGQRINIKMLVNVEGRRIGDC